MKFFSKNNSYKENLCIVDSRGYDEWRQSETFTIFE